MPNIWGNADIAIMGAGQGVWPKLFFLVHVTMSTGPLASPPPRGGVSWSLPIFAPFLPVFPLVVISCWGMLETCASVSGHHFSHIKSHFIDFKQNLKNWGYLQKRLFRKVLPASKGALLNWCDRILTPLTNSEFCCQSNGANSIQVSCQNFCQIWWEIVNFHKK